MTDTRISQLPSVITPNISDELPVNNGGDTRKMTLTQVAAVLGLTAHLADADIHAPLDDLLNTNANLWSAGKISTELALRAALAHTHGVADITGILPVAKGGTGLGAININQLLYASANNVLAALTLGSALSITGGVLNVNFPAVTMPALYTQTTAPRDISGQTFIVDRIAARDQDNVVNLYKDTQTTVNLAVSGVNGRATNQTVQNSAWYYLYEIGKANGADPALMLSTVNVAGGGVLTGLPTDYIHANQTAAVFRTDASGNLRPMTVLSGWPTRPTIRWDVDHTHWNGAAYVAGTANVFDNTIASSGVWAALALSSWMPPTSRNALLRAMFTNTGGTYVSLNFRESASAGRIRSAEVSATSGPFFVPVRTTTGQQVEIARQSGLNTQNFKIDVVEFTVTEVYT